MKYLSLATLCLLLLVTGCTSVPTSEPVLTPTQTPEPSLTSTPTPTFTPTPTSPMPMGQRTVFSRNGNDFYGTVYGQGATAVILANMTDRSELEWNPFVRVVDLNRFTIATFNYFLSDPGYYNAGMDTLTVLEHLRAGGFKRVVCIGASVGVTACARVANEPEIVGLGLIAGANNSGETIKKAYPKLFLAGADDDWAYGAQMVYSQAAEPKSIVLLPGTSAHGTDLFYDLKNGEAFLKLLVDFMNGLP